MRQQHPEVVLVSPQLSDGPLVGFDLVQEMRESSPAARAIMLLDAIEPRMVINAFQVGAKGVFSRDRSVEALAKCIELVHDGQIWVSTNELHMILQALAKRTLFKPQGAAGAKLLTDREAEVATLVAEGLKNYEIAERMQLSAHTVKNYLYRVYEKLGIYSRVELTARVLTWARREDQERSPSGSERLAG